MGFPAVPTELQLYGMEECIICPRLLFFQMKTHFMDGCTRVLGNVVNVPADVAPTVQTLPRSLSDAQTIVVKYKQKLEFKKCEFQENVCPYAVWRAVHYLLKIVIFSKMKIFNLILIGSTVYLIIAVHW